MGAAVIPVFLVGSTLYAQAVAQLSFYLTSSGSFVYVPRSPRLPILMVWPSIMNPAVAEQVAKFNERHRDYLKIQCDKKTRLEVQPITLYEVHESVYRTYEGHEGSKKAPNLWHTLVPELITWLSETALECGFYTIFEEVRHQIYRFIDSNRPEWVTGLRELVYIIIEVVAVIHNKTGAFVDGPQYASLNWLEQTHESYELWYMSYPSALQYLKKIILNSLDIVMAWLYSYIVKHADPASVCDLGNFDMVPSGGWHQWLDNSEDSMEVMADTFMTCKLHKVCNYKVERVLFTATKGFETILWTKENVSCGFHCSDLPMKYKKITYAYAYMTTVAGYDYHCYHFYISHTNETAADCYHRVVDQLMMSLQKKACYDGACSKHKHCCEEKKQCCEEKGMQCVTNFHLSSNYTNYTNYKDLAKLEQNKNIKNIKVNRHLLSISRP